VAAAAMDKAFAGRQIWVRRRVDRLALAGLGAGPVITRVPGGGSQKRFRANFISISSAAAATARGQAVVLALIGNVISVFLVRCCC